jgi:exopolysaccharide biosynthesis polyprenyl glycosylphosphotransferase
MFKERARTLQTLSLTLDVFCTGLAFGLALVLRAFQSEIPLLRQLPVLPLNAEPTVRSDYAVLLVVSVLAWVFALRQSGVYASHRSERLVTVVMAYARAFIWAGLSTAAVVFVLKLTPISRLFFAYYFTLAFILLTAKQAIVIAVLRRLREKGYNQRHALVIGSGKPAGWFARVLLDAKHTGYHLLGLVLTQKVVSTETFSVPVLGELSDVESIVGRHVVDEVFIVGGAGELARLAGVAEALVKQGKIVSLVSVLSSGLEGVRGRVTEFAGVPMISFGPMPRDELNAGIKRFVDIGVASLALVACAPLMMLVALLVKTFDPGPVFFRQVRLGVGGRPFVLWKFRSMRVDAEQILERDPELRARYVAGNFKLPEWEDPRVSGIGAFLRRTSLDELPQLYNILRGDMTLVGPRPIVPEELAMYAPYDAVLVAVKPGLTGHWQVSGRSHVSYPERAHMDLDYVAGHSVWSDLAIIARTLPSVVRRRGAH